MPVRIAKHASRAAGPAPQRSPRLEAFDDAFEPNLVFLFAPIYLGVVASVLAVVIVLASWRRRRAEPV